jgi:hypothetical protein
VKHLIKYCFLILSFYSCTKDSSDSILPSVPVVRDSIVQLNQIKSKIIGKWRYMRYQNWQNVNDTFRLITNNDFAQGSQYLYLDFTKDSCLVKDNNDIVYRRWGYYITESPKLRFYMLDGNVVIDFTHYVRMYTNTMITEDSIGSYSSTGQLIVDFNRKFYYTRIK